MIGRAALRMTAEKLGKGLSDSEEQEILGAIRSLPPHPGVRTALDDLRHAGLRLASLTNSTQAVAEEQVGNAGLRDYFEQVLSADAVRRYKPAAEV